MPYLTIRTNVAVEPEQQQSLLRQASEVVSGELGKPERFVMVSVEPQQAMLFAGSDEPLAYMELKSIGLPQDRTQGLSAALASLAVNLLSIPQDRVYVEFSDAERHMWGWNGGTF